MSERTFLKDTKYRRVLVGLLLAAIIYGLASLIVYLRLEHLREQVTLQISEQQTLLVSVAETTARNGADAVTETIVKDCSVQERTDFDDLLGRLTKGLSAAELSKLERLFGRCGGFYAQRKAIMVSRLTREIEVYTDHVSQLETLMGDSVYETYKVDVWKRLAEQEMKQSELFSSLVVQQEKIINTLIAGKQPDSEEMKVILQEAKETQEMLLMTNRQAATTRTELIPL